MLYESLLLLGVLSVGFLVPHILIGMRFDRTAPGIFLLAHVFALLGMYFVWLWRRDGQTLAMQTWRIRVTAADGATLITLRQALIRYTLAWPSVLTGAGLLWALFDPDRQFLHDRLAGTRLVMAPRAEPDR